MRKKWRELVSKARSVYDFYLVSAKSRFDLNSGIGKKQASEEVIPVLARITNAVEQAHYIKKFARLLDVVEASVMDEISRWERTETSEVGRKRLVKEDSKKKSKTREGVLEEYFLALLLQGGDKVFESVDDISIKLVSQPGIRRVITKLLTTKRGKYKAGEFISALPAELGELAQGAFLADLNLSPETQDFGEELGRVVKELGEIGLRRELDKLSASIRELEGKSRLTSSEEGKLVKLRQEFSKASKGLSHLAKK